jgi:hypothetical protein
MPTVYKQLTQAEYESRTTNALTADERTEVRSIVSRFVELFKAAHL